MSYVSRRFMMSIARIEDNYLQGAVRRVCRSVAADASDSAGSVTSVVAEVASDSSSEVQGVQTIQSLKRRNSLVFVNSSCLVFQLVRC